MYDAREGKEEEEPAGVSGTVYGTGERMVIYLGLTWRENITCNQSNQMYSCVTEKYSKLIPSEVDYKKKKKHYLDSRLLVPH